ncbi:hypothetical protein PR048_033007 [Dryococelus australis]|uniref:Integrase catalytic domain-containing protein n=1 Tax=Dryococelus australis TaxID=614101 RepID=A0ABQ9G3V0_9NEOP|nr:hypothetical protein PR048_033007 [Dryococelus australis]
MDTSLRVLTVQLKEELRKDGRLQKVVQELETDICRDFMKEKFELKEDYLFQNVSTTWAKWILCIPNLYRKEPTNHLKLCVDLFCPLPTVQRGGGGLNIFLFMVDYFTKFVKLYSIKRATAQVITEKVLGCHVLEVGQPKKIISDNGSQFRNDKWKTLTSILGIELGFTAVLSPSI